MDIDAGTVKVAGLAQVERRGNSFVFKSLMLKMWTFADKCRRLPTFLWAQIGFVMGIQSFGRFGRNRPGIGGCRPDDHRMSTGCPPNDYPMSTRCLPNADRCRPMPTVHFAEAGGKRRVTPPNPRAPSLSPCRRVQDSP